MFKFQKKAVAGIKAGNLHIVAAGRQTGKSTLGMGGPVGAIGVQGMAGHSHSITGATGPMGASTNVATPKWKILPGQFVLSSQWPQRRTKEPVLGNENDTAAWQKMGGSTTRVRMSIPRFGERPWVVARVTTIFVSASGNSTIHLDKSIDNKSFEWEAVPEHEESTIGDSNILAVFETEDEANEAIDMLRLTDRAHDVMKIIFDAKQEMLNHLHDGDLDRANNIANEYRKLLGKITEPAKEFGTIVKLFAADS